MTQTYNIYTHALTFKKNSYEAQIKGKTFDKVVIYRQSKKEKKKKVVNRQVCNYSPRINIVFMFYFIREAISIYMW